MRSLYVKELYTDDWNFFNNNKGPHIDLYYWVIYIIIPLIFVFPLIFVRGCTKIRGHQKVHLFVCTKIKEYEMFLKPFQNDPSPNRPKITKLCRRNFRYFYRKKVPSPNRPIAESPSQLDFHRRNVRRRNVPSCTKAWKTWTSGIFLSWNEESSLNPIPHRIGGGELPTHVVFAK